GPALHSPARDHHLLYGEPAWRPVHPGIPFAGARPGLLRYSDKPASKGWSPDQRGQTFTGAGMVAVGNCQPLGRKSFFCQALLQKGRGLTSHIDNIKGFTSPPKYPNDKAAIHQRGPAIERSCPRHPDQRHHTVGPLRPGHMIFEMSRSLASPPTSHI